MQPVGVTAYNGDEFCRVAAIASVQAFIESIAADHVEAAVTEVIGDSPRREPDLVESGAVAGCQCGEHRDMTWQLQSPRLPEPFRDERKPLGHSGQGALAQCHGEILEPLYERN